MNDLDRTTDMTRRDLLRAGAAAAAAAALGPLARGEPTTAPASQPGAATQPIPPLPVRPLGATGAKVSVLNQGTYGLSRRLLDYTYAQGVRYFDTADCYRNGQSEAEIGDWFSRTGKRKEIFLATADHPGGSGKGDLGQLLTRIDKRLASLKTDYIDLFFIHGISVEEYGPQALEWPRSREFKEVADKLRKSGKTKFVGFTCHDRQAPEFLQAAAEGGFLDAVMMSYNPVIGAADDKLNRAMDACAKAGIGMIAMKTMRGIGDQLKKGDLKGTPLPVAVIHAVLSDDRISSICSEMRSFEHVEQNTGAARSFRKAMTSAERHDLQRAIVAAGMTFCPGCPACRGGVPGTQARVHDIVRYLSYYEQDGDRATARALYRALPAEARDWSGADLAAARQACACGVDYAAVLGRAEVKLA